MKPRRRRKPVGTRRRRWLFLAILAAYFALLAEIGARAFWYLDERVPPDGDAGVDRRHRERDRELQGRPACLGGHADVGGRTPGSTSGSFKIATASS